MEDKNKCPCGKCHCFICGNQMERDQEIARLQKQLDKAKECLGKIADPRKRDHQEPDAYTQLGCVMNMADETLKELENKL